MTWIGVVVITPDAGPVAAPAVDEDTHFGERNVGVGNDIYAESRPVQLLVYGLAQRPGVLVGNADDKIVHHVGVDGVSVVEGISRNAVLIGAGTFAWRGGRAELYAEERITDLVISAAKHGKKDAVVLGELMVQLADVLITACLEIIGSEVIWT